MKMIVFLYISLASLIVSGITALIYELYAIWHSDTPFITTIVVTYIKAHNIIASAITGLSIGFVTFLILHFFSEK